MAQAVCVFLCVLPVTLVVPVLGALIQTRWELSDFSASLFMSVNMLGALIAAPLAGLLSDRLGRRRWLITTALLSDGLLLFAIDKSTQYGAALGLRLLEGAAHIFALSIIMALSADLARVRGSGRTMGVIGTALTLGVACGPPLGGALGNVDPSLPLLVGAALALVAALLSCLLLRDFPQKNKPADACGTWQLLTGRSKLLIPYSFAFVDRFTVGFFVSCFPLYLANVHGYPPGRIGFLLAAFLLPFALFCYPVGKAADRFPRSWFLAGGSVLYGLGATLVGIVNPAWLMPLLLWLGLTSSVMFVPSLVLVTELCGQDLRATAMGGFHSAGSLGFLLGPIAAGALSQIGGYPFAFVVAGLAEILCVLVCLPALRRLERNGEFD